MRQFCFGEDGLLSKAAGDCGAKKPNCCARLEDFTSRVRLQKEQAVSEFVESLFAEATREFYSKDKPDCFYWREKIHKRIVERAADLIPPPDETDFLDLIGPKTWERQTEERITLGTTRFEKHEAPRFFWKTEVKSAAAFSGKGFLDIVTENIRVSIFAVRWTSQVSVSAESTNITDVRFEDISLVSKQMLLDTAESRKQWSLPAKPVPIAPALADISQNPPSTTST